MRRIILATCIALAAAISGLAVWAPVAHAAVVTNTSVPFNQTFPNPCTGEAVQLTGQLHVLITETVDSSGGGHLYAHFQPQGVSGVGLTTGATYHAVGETITHETANGAFETSFVNNFKVISNGNLPNFLVHDTFHVTVNANGDVTAVVVNSTAECRG